MATYELNSPAPPPYMVTEPVQLPTPTPPPTQPGLGQIPPQNDFPQAHTQDEKQQPFQSQQFTQSSQGPIMVQSTQGQWQPTQGIPQQPPPQYQTITPQQQQQQQQVQSIIQNMPPEKLQIYQHQAQQMMMQQQFQQPMMQQPLQPVIPQQPMMPQQQPPRHYTTSAPQGLFGPKHSSSGSHGSQTGPKDERQTGGVQRFFGDTLFGRVARSSVQTATSALKMPSSLSPWGDNNPVTLPNVRYRDAVLFTTFAFVGAPLVDGISDGITGAFGADSFISEIVSSGAGTIVGSTIIKYSVFQIVEQAIDKGIIEHMLPEEEKMLQTTNVKSLQVGIKHKLMGVDADLRFTGIYPSQNSQKCDKGWFCPYLFASARTPQIPRSNDFSISQFFGPFLNGTYVSIFRQFMSLFSRVTLSPVVNDITLPQATTKWPTNSSPNPPTLSVCAIPIPKRISAQIAWSFSSPASHPIGQICGPLPVVQAAVPSSSISSTAARPSSSP
jgi:hypothetical protein